VWSAVAARFIIFDLTLDLIEKKKQKGNPR